MSCSPVNCVPTKCWEIKDNIELVMIGIANILFLAGAVYILYLNGKSGIDLIASSDFWGLLIPTALLCITFFTSLIKKQEKTKLNIDKNYV